jgi:hypothetical protein
MSTLLAPGALADTDEVAARPAGASEKPKPEERDSGNRKSPVQGLPFDSCSI